MDLLPWRDLTRLAPDAGATWGGKAAGLARLLAAGACVPAGFALPAGTSPPEEWGAGERRRFAAAVDALRSEGPVAVRSSAVGEDGAAQSFAGIYETVLGVADGDAALGAVARCIASAGSARVRAYGGDEDRPVGVVVQRQVDARAAGVLFTADPTGSGGALLEAVAGLGESLVSGQCEPWRWRLHLSGRRSWEAHTEAGHDTAPLTTEAAISLAAEGRVLAQALGEPLDLEWALDRAGRIWWLQARAITALREPAPPHEIEPGCAGAHDGPITVWTNVNVRETMPDPLAPLAWSLWRDRLMPSIARLNLDFGNPSGHRQLSVADRVDGRVYWNVNAVSGIPGFGAMVERAFSVIDARSSASFAELQQRGVIQPRRFPTGRRGVARAWLRSQRQSLPAIWRALDPESSLRCFEAFGARMIERQQAPLGGRSDAELLAEIHEVTSPEIMDVPLLFASLLLSLLAFMTARRAFEDHPAAQGMLGVGIRRNPTTLMSLEIDALAEAAAPLGRDFLESEGTEDLFGRLEGSAEGIAWMARFRRFLDWNGQRCPREFDLAAPRWSEAPEMLLELIRAHLREPAKEGARERIDRLEGEREAAVEAALAAAPAWRRPLMRRLASAATRHLPLREAGKHYLLFVFQRVRSLALELGARMTAAGALREPEEVLLLDLDELGDLVHGHLSGPALRRRLDRAAADLKRWRSTNPEAFVRSDRVPVGSNAAVPDADGVLRGAGISTGVAEGSVRILHEPDPSALREGEILVVHLADPGWTPLFPRAGGLVMEVGGLMCHAAVVSRELGIPAVFGVAGAIAQLEDGQRVRVDAEAGTITPL